MGECPSEFYCGGDQSDLWKCFMDGVAGLYYRFYWVSHLSDIIFQDSEGGANSG